MGSALAITAAHALVWAALFFTNGFAWIGTQESSNSARSSAIGTRTTSATNHPLR